MEVPFHLLARGGVRHHEGDMVRHGHALAVIPRLQRARCSLTSSIFRFYADRWQPVQCEYADRVEQEHLQRFLSHKMADYVWDAQTSTRLEKQVSNDS